MGDLKKIFSGPKIPDPPKPPKPMEDEAAVPGVTPDDLRKKLATRLSARTTLLEQARQPGNQTMGGTR